MPYSKKFLKLLKATEKQYLGKPVKKPYQKDYGKVYSKQETQSVAFRIAKKLGWKV